MTRKAAKGSKVRPQNKGMNDKKRVAICKKPVRKLPVPVPKLAIRHRQAVEANYPPSSLSNHLNPMLGVMNRLIR